MTTREKDARKWQQITDELDVSLSRRVDDKADPKVSLCQSTPEEQLI